MSNQLSGHILLVEDDQVNQIVIKGLLIILGCKVSIAKNGEEALSMLMAADASYDVVLMDIGLPDFNGLEVTHQLRQSNAKLKSIYIIALTGHKDEQTCLDNGMNSFIAKPTTKEILYQELKKFLISN